MKKTLLKMVMPLLALASSLVASESAGERPVQSYNSRVSIHPTHYSYEYLASDELYFAFDAHKACSYSQNDLPVAHIIGDLRLGRNTQLGTDTAVRPFIGVTAIRSLSFLMDPTKMYGMVGFSVEQTFADLLTVGVTAKGLLGGIVGKNYSQERKLYYGVDVSVPLTVRFGRTSHWEMRLEPFVLALNDGEYYLGHRSGLAYRF